MTITDWFKANGFTFDPARLLWCIAWSCRTGYDFTSLEFGNDKDDEWFAVLGHHASGNNPRMLIGICRSLEDVQTITEAVRRINGYPTAEAEAADRAKWQPTA